MAVTLDNKILNDLSGNNYFSDGLDQSKIRENRTLLEGILESYLYKGNFDAASPKQKAYYIEKALEDLNKHTGFKVKHNGKDIPYAAWLDTLSEAKRKDAIEKIGQPNDYTKSFARKKSALDKFIGGENGLNREYKKTTKSHNPLLNLWDNVAGHRLSSARAFLQPLVSWYSKGRATSENMVSVMGWGSLTAGLVTIAGFAFVTAATGGLGALAWLPATAGALGIGGAVFTGVQTKNAWDDYQVAKVEAADKQIQENEAFYAKNQEYRNGKEGTATKHPVVIELDGVTIDSFRGKGAKLNIRDNSVKLSRELWQKYGDDLDISFDPSGKLTIGLVNKSDYPYDLSERRLKAMLDDIKKDCGIENAPVSSVTILGERQDDNSLLDISDKFKAIDSRQTAEKATVTLKKELEGLDTKTLDKILIEAYTKEANTDTKLKNIAAQVLVSTIPGFSTLKGDDLSPEFLESVVTKLNERVKDNFGVQGNVVPTAWSCRQVASAFAEKQDASNTEVLKALVKSYDTLSPQSVGMVAAMVSVGIKPKELVKFRDAVSEIKSQISTGQNFKVTADTLAVLQTLQSKIGVSEIREVIGTIHEALGTTSFEQDQTEAETVFENIWYNQQTKTA